MSLPLHRITMVKFCLTVLMVAASSWSKVWDSLAWTGDGLPARWRTFRRHFVTKISIPPFAYMYLSEEFPPAYCDCYSSNCSGIPNHVPPGLCALTKHGSKEIPALTNKRSRVFVPSFVIEVKGNRFGLHDERLGNQAKCDFVSDHLSHDLSGAEEPSFF